MGLYNRKEFAALCNTTAAVITTNINRNKIILFDKKIDSENPVNKAFFEKYRKKAEAEIKERNKKKATTEELYEEVVEKVKPKTKIRFKKATDKLKKLAEQEEANQKGQEMVDWDLRKKRAEALLKERNAEKALLSVKKMYGEMVPTDFIITMFTSYTKTILSVFDNSIMNLAGVYCDELAGGDREALARVNQKLNEEFQRIINSAAEVAKSDLKNTIKQYSVKRGKGERK